MKFNKLEIKDPNCTQCSLSAYCSNKCQANDLSKDSNLMIIASHPDDYNEAKDTVMQGDNYKSLYAVLDKVLNIDLSQVHFTYLVKCNPKGKEVNSKDLTSCLKYLKQEIEFIKPKAILCLGSFVAKSLFGFSDEMSIQDMNNSNQSIGFKLSDGSEISVPTKFTYSSQYINYNPYHLKQFAKDIHAAYSIAIDAIATDVPTQVKIITTIKDFKQLLEYCVLTKICSWDFETNGIQHRHYGETLFATGLAISFQQGSGYFIPLEQFDSPIPEGQRKKFTLQIIELFAKTILSNPDMLIVGQNLKYDLHVITHYIGYVEILADYDDTMYQNHYIDNTRAHGLKEMVTRIYPSYGGYETEVNKYKWDSVPLPLLSKYACVDSDMTLRLKTVFDLELMQDVHAYKCYKNNTIPTAKVTHRAECTGLKVDVKYLESSINEVKEMIVSCENIMMSNPKLIRFEKFNRQQQDKEDIKKLTDKLQAWRETHNPGTKTEQNIIDQLQKIKLGQHTNYKPFNAGSPKQLEHFLYSPEGLGLPKPRNPKTKKVGGTGVEALNMINDQSGFIDSLLEYRSLNKTLSTYLVGIMDKLDSNGYVHTDFKVTGTDTGRLSSKDPNVQNMTNEYKQKYETTKKAASFIKGMFVPPTDHYIVQVDYSQAELRVIAYYAQCAYMLNAYLNGVDLHAQTAADVLGITLEEFYQLPKDEQKLQRYRAKAVNFGFIYGMSAESFRHYAFNDYGITYTVSECIKIRNIYFEKRPELLVYHETYKLKAKKFGGVRTLFGSKRILTDINSTDSYKMSNAERQAINTPIQGTSGLMTVFAVNMLNHRLNKDTKFVNTVHDSIIFYIPKTIIDSEVKKIIETCENLPMDVYFDRHFQEDGKIPVSMKVDIEYSDKSWADLKEYKINLVEN